MALLFVAISLKLVPDHLRSAIRIPWLAAGSGHRQDIGFECWNEDWRLGHLLILALMLQLHTLRRPIGLGHFLKLQSTGNVGLSIGQRAQLLAPLIIPSVNQFLHFR